MGVIINFPTLIESTGIDTSDATATIIWYSSQ